jgi:hypothetical protein
MSESQRRSTRDTYLFQLLHFGRDLKPEKGTQTHMSARVFWGKKQQYIRLARLSLEKTQRADDRQVDKHERHITSQEADLGCGCDCKLS